MADARPLQVGIAGGGIAGLCCALELLERGARVQLFERASSPGAQSCSWYAGGMLAPWCELEAAGEPLIEQLGRESLAWWRARGAPIREGGTLVLAGARDLPELTRFAQRTRQYRWLDAGGIAGLEPDLAGRFERGLYFPEEAWLEPRQVLAWLRERSASLGAGLRDGCALDAQGLKQRASEHDGVLDCRGLAARDVLPDLRGVRGEMLVLESAELTLRRPVRLLHPRLSVYLIPRTHGRFMLGATSIESDDTGPISARAVMQLLGAAYALHPAFAEARVLESGAQARPAFPDNLPRLRRAGPIVHVNGLYRHGFLLAPALARRAAAMLLEGEHCPELDDGEAHEDRPERRLA